MTRNAPRASARSDEFTAPRQRSSRRSPARDDDLQATSATRRRPARRQPNSDPLDLSATSPRLSLPSLSVPTPATMGRRKPAADARPAPPMPTAKRQTTLRERARISHSLRDVEDDWDESDWRDREWDEEPEEPRPSRTGGRIRASSSARPLKAVTDRSMALVVRHAEAAVAQLSTDSVPNVAAVRPLPRPQLYTRALIRTARKPWSLTRMICIALAITAALITGAVRVGEASQPLMGFDPAAGSGPAVDFIWPVNAVTARVQAQTQGKRPDLYDSVDQFNQWWGAACSAAVLSEVLTAYKVPDITIGKMIDELGPTYISPSGGLLNYEGFNQVAQKHGFRADIYVERHLTLNQMKYLTNTLGIPVIVNVRVSYGYYHFFAGGHFMALTAIDDQGMRLVDSSLYYVKYMPMAVFNSMFTGRTTVIVPKGYEYTLPDN
ncbi:MAG TPA: C39 family peptidase [Ktedonobacterales bacterium]|jgi:predicted double-glycine peptidase